MSNKIIQRIRIDGKNWNDIINLPCVQSLDKGDERIKRDTPTVVLYDSYLPIKFRLKSMPKLWESLTRLNDPKSPWWQRALAKNGHIGDELVQYDNDTWQIIRKRKQSISKSTLYHQREEQIT